MQWEIYKVIIYIFFNYTTCFVEYKIVYIRNSITDIQHFVYWFLMIPTRFGVLIFSCKSCYKSD